jgi:hypothetical protein
MLIIQRKDAEAQKLLNTNKRQFLLSQENAPSAQVARASRMPHRADRRGGIGGEDGTPKGENGASLRRGPVQTRMSGSVRPDTTFAEHSGAECRVGSPAHAQAKVWGVRSPEVPVSTLAVAGRWREAYQSLAGTRSKPVNRS